MGIHRMYPTSDADLDGGIPTGEATGWECLDDPFNDPNEDTDYLLINTSAQAREPRFGLSAMENAQLVNSVSLYFRSREEASFGTTHQPFLYLGGAAYYGAIHSLPETYATFSKVWTENPVTSKRFTQAELDAAQAGIKQAIQVATVARCTQLYLEVDYVPLPTAIEPVRDAGSRRLWYRRIAVGVYTVDVPLVLGLRVELLDFFPVSHFAGPEDQGQGWQEEPWQRRPFLVVGHFVDQARELVTLTLWDQRPFLCLYRDVAWASRAPSVSADSIPRIAKGGVTRTITRASSVWLPSPAGGKIVEITDDLEAHAENGDLHEQASTNEVPQSSFKNGAAAVFTGWTETGSGVVSEETSILLWDESVVGRCPKFTAGNPIAVDFQLTSNVTANIAANAVGRLSIDHLDADAGEPLSFALVRLVDGKFWRDADSSWQVGTLWNDMTGSVVWHRHKSKLMDVGANITTLVVAVGVPSATGTVDQVNYVGHVQWEAKRYPTSRILTEAAAVTRAESRLLISNDNGARTWNNAQGAFVCEGSPEWDDADIGAGIHTLAAIVYDAQNYEWLYYDAGTGNVVFERLVATVSFKAVLAWAPVAGTVATIMARWTGSNAELGLTAFTSSVFVDGVKGTDVVTGAAPTEDTPANLEIGSAEDTDRWDGQIRLLHSYQYVPSDAEAQRLP